MEFVARRWIQPSHVLVHTGEGDGEGDRQPRLLQDLPLKPLRHRLPVLQDYAGRLLLAVATALDEQGEALVVDDASGDAHGVGALCGTHGPRSPRPCR
ncbi:hypothetical protein GCM10010400_57500 [Streptomyces aculeolatus]